jgi:hypothetical protein
MNLSPTTLVVLFVLAALLVLILSLALGCWWFNKKAVPLFQQMENGEPPPGLYEAIKEEGGNNNLDKVEDEE